MIVDLTPEEESMLDEAIAEADAEPDGGVLAADFLRELRAADTFVKDFTVETERETDGRWIAEVVDVPGAVAYGSTREEALAKAKALAQNVLAGT